MYTCRMKWNKYFYHWYYYTQSQKRGFIALLIVFFAVQLLLYWYDHQPRNRGREVSLVEGRHRIQKEMDSLRLLQTAKKDTIYPFNPNYLTDYKGYILELTLEELDRLFAYRTANHYVNSSQEFQEVTGVSDAWIAKYSPYFVFGNRRKYISTTNNVRELAGKPKEKAKSIVVQDINRATIETLQEIYGIGPALSKRIIDDRTKWGGYVHIDQVKFVYGLSEQVIASLLQQYAVLSSPPITPIDLNNATVNDLKNIPYLNYYLAREIIKYRSLHGDFVNKEQLKEIEKIPLDKIHIISLYLEIRN